MVTNVTRGRALVGRAVVVLAVLLALRVWWVRPVELTTGPLLREATFQGGFYRLTPRAGVTIAALVRTSNIDGYDPGRHSQFQEALEGKRFRYVRDGSHHHYVEYIGERCRIQEHTAMEEIGIVQWFEFVPSNVSVDSFFVQDIAILLDSTRPKYKVYIPDSTDQTYMTVSVSDGQVAHVVWARR